MSLIIEDGSIVANAASYVSEADATAYAAARGVTLPADEASLQILLIKSMDWLESMRDSYQGTKVSGTQSLQWPREGVVIDSFTAESDAIPKELIAAQSQVVMDIYSGLDPDVNDTGVKILRRKVDVIETTFADPTTASSVPYLRKAMNLLRPLFRGSAGTIEINR
jgi:hypothetical protein